MKRSSTASGIALVCAVMLACQPVARAQGPDPFAEGAAAYERGDFAGAYAKWRVLADQGDARAQSNIGTMYATGSGVPQDAGEAVRWYQMAAGKGEKGAQTNLGAAYHEGVGVPVDPVEAMKWFRLAADQGYSQAQFSIGVLYDKGQGVKVDYAEAMKWYRLAAVQNNPNAIANIGAMYALGHGVSQDYVQAYLWFTNAVRLAPDAASRQQQEQNRNLAVNKMTPQQASEARRLAETWTPQRP
jgi:TPR repeat protein